MLKIYLTFHFVKARQNEFTTNVKDTPMIVQFAANCSTDFLHATQMIYNYADGVDLNCGNYK